jgi:hypothetical protein
MCTWNLESWSIADITAVALAIVTIVGVIVALISLIHQIKAEKKVEELTAFAEYTKRYQEIMLNLPEDLNDSDATLTTTQKRYLWAYLDLCSEEYFLYQKGYINKTVWNEWKAGIKEALKQTAIVDYWQQKMEKSSYTDFSTLIQGLLKEIECETNTM